MLVCKVVVWFFAAIGFFFIAALTWLWLEARPVLNEAHAQYESLPVALHCPRAQLAQPPHYPSGARELESIASAERSAYAAACHGANMQNACAYMTGVGRSLGFSMYRRFYLTDCEVRALSLHGQTHLSRALADLYPERDPASLTDAEQSCLVARTRYSSSRRYFCQRNPTCCPSGLAADSAPPIP